MKHNLILTFARVFTNRATTIAYQRIFRVLFDLVLQLTGSPPAVHIFADLGWNCIMQILIMRKKGLGLALNEIDNTKENLGGTFAESESAINQVFDDIQAIEENAAEMARIGPTCITLSNRRGRDLKLLTAILHGQKLDKERFTTIYVHQKYNIPNKGRDKAKKLTKVVPTKRKQNEHTGSNKKTKTNIIEIEENDKENICTISSRKIKTRNGTEGDDKESEFTLKLSELEFQERALALRERELILREKEAKIREMELSLAEKEHVLNSTK
ncbi:uncharacterized protein OCT59_027911 [Rhizophagus irregularis]|uniref:uncharacterized protein n=1 Tax=Rhizophagus irregularis TaxID=588596 RepID=UPI00333170A2|nr:hypothetical protein OCT59_027911 [Rhizophagus irregularis]